MDRVHDHRGHEPGTARGSAPAPQQARFQVPREPERRAAGGGASNVVDVYIRHLRQKLEASSDVPLIHTVRGVGYKIDDSE